MKCANGHDLGPGERFCGDCGAVAQTTILTGGAVTQTTVRVDSPWGSTVLSGPPAQRGTYSAEISRANPGCLIFFVDQSGSMEEPIAGGTGQKKKDMVADAINRLLYNIILRCGKEGGVRPYFDIGVWGYGGTSDVRSAFGDGLLSITQVNERSKRVETRRRRVPDGAGGVFEEELPFPVWFDPAADGTTPMKAAFDTVVAPLGNWLGRHQNSFPPIIIHLSDGAYYPADQNPAQTAWQLMQMGTSAGNVLLFNCHISKEPGASVLFPNDQQAAALQGLTRELYDISSPLPEKMRQAAQEKGYQCEAGARGYAFNADIVTMIDFLDIGTQPAADRLE
jgi:hypothetical protein